jgi:hypothetical protein
MQGADGLDEGAEDRRFRTARIILVTIGVAGLLLGGVVLVMKQMPVQIVGVGVWIVGAIILHDAILSPLVFVVNLLVRRAGRRVSRGVLAIAQGGVVVGAVLTLVVVPEVYAKTLGPNETVLPFDYGLRLAVMWVVVIALAVGTSLLYLRHARRRLADRELAEQNRAG